MCHHDNMYVKVAYDNFDNERRHDDDVSYLWYDKRVHSVTVWKDRNRMHVHDSLSAVMNATVVGRLYFAT